MTLLTYREWRKKYVRHWEGRLYVAYNDDGSSSPKEAVTVSEATGWGLLISVLERQHEDFQGFLLFYDQFLNQRGLMSWQLCRTTGPVYVNPDNGGSNCATDGDMDAAYALLLAERIWPGHGYHAKGIRACAALWDHCINKITFCPLIGDWVGRPGDRGGPQGDVCFHDITRPSDFCLTHFLLFSQEDTPRAEGWRRCLDSCITQLCRGLAPHQTGLMPDFAEYDHTGQCYKPVLRQVLERPEDGTYGWNACRIPWRLAVYYLHTGDPRLLAPLQRMADFFSSQAKLAAGYDLSGVPLVSYGATSFLAPVWTLHQVLENYAEARRVAGHIHAIIAGGWSNYYGDTVLMLCQLQLLEPPTANLPPAATSFPLNGAPQGLPTQ